MPHLARFVLCLLQYYWTSFTKEEEVLRPVDSCGAPSNFTIGHKLTNKHIRPLATNISQPEEFIISLVAFLKAAIAA